MKKTSTAAAKQSRNISQPQLTIGLDLGDRNSWYCVVDEAGRIQLEQRVRTTAKALREVFGGMPRSRIGLEIGTHSPWISRLLSANFEAPLFPNNLLFECPGLDRSSSSWSYYHDGRSATKQGRNFSSAVLPAPTTRQRRFASFRNIGKSGVFSSDRRDDLCTSLKQESDRREKNEKRG